ncbi:transposase [Microbacterium lacticum]|uniref:Transposase n=1 Tax=Microbacterium lacticum TaxID=33885 RepID=A0A543KSW5_9MICO|nr:transposase [Microbacterium lacticum]
MSFLTEKQTARLDAVFAVEEHVEVEATWGIYQRIVAAYREPDKKKAKEMMRSVIDSVSIGVPASARSSAASPNPPTAPLPRR